MYNPQIAQTVWLPYSPQFRDALLDAAGAAFGCASTLTTPSGKPVRLDTVLNQIHKAEGPLTQTLLKLAHIGRPDVARFVTTFYPRLMPYYIQCGLKNPVHHTAYVLEYVVAITIGEGRAGGPDLDVGVLAALFHDAAQGLSTRPKITEANLKDKIRDVLNGQATLQALQEYRQDAIQDRQEHMQEGARIAGDELDAYRQKHPQALTDETIREVQRLIRCHDNPKIPVTYGLFQRAFTKDKACQDWRARLPAQKQANLSAWLAATGEEYLIDVDDWRLQVLHEADLLWMVTQDGIDADLARFPPSQAKTPRAIIDNNTALHHQEVDLYRGKADFCQYGFREGTVYRTQTGHALFAHLTQVLEDRWPAQGETP